MNTSASIAILAALGVLVYFTVRKVQSADTGGDVADYPTLDSADYSPGETTIYDVLTNPVESFAEKIDGWTGTRISKMSQVTPDLLQNPNVAAILRVIRRGEGTSDDAGYRRMFGGAMFQSFADHPRTKQTAGGYTSTAAGAYQFLASTWDETAKLLGLPDFSPASQDLAAVARIVYRKALDDVLAGDLATAMPKLGKEWASMPGSPYGQPVISMQTALNTFEQNGGALA